MDWRHDRAHPARDFDDRRFEDRAFVEPRGEPLAGQAWHGSNVEERRSDAGRPSGWRTTDRPRGESLPAHFDRDIAGRGFADRELHDPRRIERGSAVERRDGYIDTRVHEVMTRRVVTAQPDDPVVRAVRLMEECDCGSLPVVNEQWQLIGMVTDRDVALRIVGHGSDPQRARVADCMTTGVYACHANERVEECMREMSRHQVRRVPLVDDDNRLVGIVSQGDLARHAERTDLRERRAFTQAVSAVSEPSAGSRRR